MREVLSEVQRRLLESGLAEEDTIEGCRPREIAAIELATGVKLPAAYREFLTAFGNGAGMFYPATHWRFPDPCGLKSDAERLLKRNGGTLMLGEGDFPFLMHNGYTFHYFNCNAGDDPPVYNYLDGDGEFKRVFDAFSQWLLRAVDDEIKIHQSLKEEASWMSSPDGGEVVHDEPGAGG